jgi:putative PIN family toxin of toxin-antitoxin system
MTPVVLDTNVIVSALMTPAGNEAIVLLLCLRGQLSLCISPAVLAEYENVLHRPRLKLKLPEIKATLTAIRSVGLLVNTTETLKISEHEEDNRFYECASAAKADYIVTGNTKHFKKPYKTTKIVTASQLLEIVGSGKR